MKSIAAYLPILVLNFNLFSIFCTIRTPCCKDLLFCKRNLLDNTPQSLLLNVHETQQICSNCLQGGDRELHRLLKYIQIKQTVKICSFGLVWWFFRWNLNKTKVAHYFHNMKLKALPKKHFPKKFTKFTLSTNYFSQAGQILICFPFSDNLAFCRHGLSVFTKLDLLLLASVNIRNRGI